MVQATSNILPKLHSKFQSPTHTYTKSHIYILLHVKYNSMPHPPQEGSNRSLAYGALLDVLWQMYHAWITYEMLRRTILVISKSYEAKEAQQETCYSACLYKPYGTIAIPGSPIGALVGLP